MNSHSSSPASRIQGRRSAPRLVLSLALGLALPLAVPPATAVTLGEDVSAALSRAAEQARVAAIRGEGQAVRRHAESLVAEDPSLRLKYLSDQLTDDTGAYEWEAMVDLPLWMPGQRGVRREIAAALGGQADALDRLLRWEMAGRVREVAWSAALALGRLRQTEQALKTAQALQDNVATRVEAGELPRVDLLLARQDALEREAERQAASLEAQDAMARYAQLTGRTALPAPLLEPVGNAGSLPADHPLLGDAEGALVLARAERDRAQRDRVGHPVLSLGGKRAQDQRGGDIQNMVQMEINIPFGLAAQSAPELAAAERAYTERSTQRHQVQLEAERSLALARLERQGADAALAVAEQRHALAQEALGLVRRAFDLGETDLTSLLRAEERAREAGIALELSRLERGRAQARLNQALGVIPQ
ncbi:TolC family protein [Thiohalocapsa marina]|uniref:TolC family protein n=1 Tax=Thiohalocapsa marina TaxID=424902 RepID=A0A5M8FRN4_9GAMM|nr:TolC family protein [Thiohalocapsa marina]KAA6185595.1 TolC family protein [Thiohalocapsa marina]